MSQKPESTQFHEDQEDLLMSYLNSDYMSSSTPCWNPPTPSSTPTDQSPVSTPTCQNFFDISGWNHHHHHHHQPNTPNGEPLLNEYPFIVPEHHQHAAYFHQPASPPSSSSSSCCASDTEHTRKRRGRKKRDVCTPPLAPAMIAPAPVTKQLATLLPAQQQEEGKYVNRYIPVLKPVVVVAATSSTATTTTTTTDDGQKAATIAKRQERLIKNRAAALLSRKRKREHLTALEDQRNGLSNENSELKQKVLALEKENLALKRRLEPQQADSKSVMIFMMILFSFAYIVSMATKLVPVKYNTTTAAKITHDESIFFQLTNFAQQEASFYKKKDTSLKRKRFERVSM